MAESAATAAEMAKTLAAEDFVTATTSEVTSNCFQDLKNRYISFFYIMIVFILVILFYQI